MCALSHSHPDRCLALALGLARISLTPLLTHLNAQPAPYCAWKVWVPEGEKDDKSRKTLREWVGGIIEPYIDEQAGEKWPLKAKMTPKVGTRAKGGWFYQVRCLKYPLSLRLPHMQFEPEHRGE